MNALEVIAKLWVKGIASFAKYKFIVFIFSSELKKNLINII